jgi:hypothetical protein
MAKSANAKLTEKRFGNDYSTNMKQTLKNYVRQPSTWLGLAKLGAALGLYSTGVGNTTVDAILGIFGVIDVIRNERGQKPLL